MKNRWILWMLLGAVGIVKAEINGEKKASPVPAWYVPQTASRLLVEKRHGNFPLIQLPAVMQGTSVSAIRVFLSSTNEAVVSVIWRDAERLMIMVDARPAHPHQVMHVYPILGKTPIAVTPATTRLVNPEPLRGTAARTAGMDYPESYEDLNMLETRCDARPVPFNVAGFNNLKETFKDWYRGDWTRKNHLVDLRSWVLVPEEGTFLFGLAGIAPAWLTIDGQRVLDHPPHQPHDRWTAGKAYPLAPGLHRFRVQTVCREEIDTGLVWKRKDESGLATNVVMITGDDLLTGRWEAQERCIQPYAVALCGKGYRFSGVEGVFVPFTCVDESAYWGGGELTRSWRMGAIPLGQQKTCQLTRRSMELPAKVALTLTAPSGEKAQTTTELVHDGRVWAEYEVTSRMVGVPAACYLDDTIQPIIRIRSNAPEGLTYELTTEIEWRGDRAPTRKRVPVVTDKSWARVYLPPFEIGQAHRLSWSLQHAGVEISRGETRLVGPPFDVLPDSVSGENLKAGDSFIVLVTSKASQGEPDLEPDTPETKGGVVLLDGLFNRGDDPAMSGLPASWKLVCLQTLQSSEQVAGMSSLQPFAAIRPLLPATTILLAPSVAEMDRKGGLEVFERRLSAMVGLLQGKGAGHPRVILVVPPEPDVLPGCGCKPAAEPCPHASAIRPYAERIIRVADVYALETVNLYTAFKTLTAGVPFVEKGILTDEGVKLAAGLLMGKL